MPLNGASVSIKGTDKGAVTDNEGRFVIKGTNVNTNSILVISFIGYETKEVSVSGQSNFFCEP